MALGLTAVNVYTSASSFGTGGYTTASFTPANNSLLCVAVTGVDEASTSVDAELTLSGGGLEWTRRAFSESLQSANDFVAWYTAPVSTGASMTLTADCGDDNIYRYILHVFTLTGYDTDSPTGGTAVYDDPNGATPVTFTLSGTLATTSYVLAAAISDGGGTITDGTTWTPGFTSSPDILTHSQYRTASTSTTVTWNQLSVGGTGCASAAFEVKAETEVFGSQLGTLTGTGASVTDPSDATGSAVVAVDDLIYAVFAEETALTVTAVTDNLGNTYTECNAGTDGGTVTGRAFYSIVTVAGTLTTVSFDTTGSTNNWAAFAAAYKGPFGDIDANPANGTSDITSPLTCPATGTLSQADEVVLAWGVANQVTAWAATSPNLLAGQASTSTASTISVPTAGTGHATTDGTNPSVPLTVANMLAGDWIYIFGGHYYRAAVAIGPTTGVWEELYSENANASTNSCGWWRKLWDGSESAVACYGSGSADDGSAYKALILRGAGDIDAVVVPATGSSTNPNAPAITTVAAGAAVLIAAQSAVSDASITAAANYTCTFTNANSTRDMSTSVGYDLTPAANPENPAGWTGWSTGNWRALIVSVAPALTSKVKVALGHQLVSATDSISPAFTVAANPTECILGTSSFGAPGGSDSITVDSAGLTLAGQSITTIDVCPITQANLSLAGQSIVSVDVCPITQANLSLSGSAITELDKISITSADLSLTGQTIDVPADAVPVVYMPSAVIGSGNPARIPHRELTWVNPALRAVIETITIDSADLTLAGQTITTADVCPITQANLTLAGQSIAVTETERISIAVADLTLAGQSVTVSETERIAITAADLTLAGQSVTVGETERVAITAADLTLAGQSITTADVCPIAPADLTLTGSTVAVTETDRIGITVADLTLTGSDVTEIDVVGITASNLTLAGQEIGTDAGVEYITIDSASLTLSGSSIISVDVCPITPADLALAGQTIAVSEIDRIAITAADISLTGSGITEVDVVGITASNLVLVGQDIGVDFTSDLMPCVVTDWGNPAPRLPAQRSWMYRPQAPAETISVDAGSLTLSGSIVAVTDIGALEYMPCVVTDWGNPAPRLPAQRSWMYRPQVPPETISVTAGELTLSGSDIAVTESGVTYVPCVVTDWGNPAFPRLAVDPTWINQNIAIRYSDTIGITASALTLSGSVVAVTDTGTDSIPVESISLTLSGSNILETGTVGISSASLTLSGSDVAVTDTNIIPIESAALTLSGSEITEVDTVSISSVALVLAGSEIVLTDTGVSRQKDGDPDYWKLPWFHVEGGTFAERLLAETLLTLSEPATESQAVKRKAREAAKKIQAYTKAAGALLSKDEIARLDRLVRQLGASQRVESIQPRIDETRALLIAQMMQQDEDEAITALLL